MSWSLLYSVREDDHEMSGLNICVNLNHMLKGRFITFTFCNRIYFFFSRDRRLLQKRRTRKYSPVIICMQEKREPGSFSLTPKT